MSWTDLERDISTLEVETIYAVYDNIDFLRQQLILRQYAPSALTPSEADYDTPINQIRAELQKIENDIDVINSVDTITSIYYNGHKTIGTSFRLFDYQRWVDILNDIKFIMTDGNRRWSMVRLSDCIPTIGGKRIVIRGDEMINE